MMKTAWPCVRGALSVIAAAALLNGCGGGNDDSAAAAPPSAAAPLATLPADFNPPPLDLSSSTTAQIATGEVLRMTSAQLILLFDPRVPNPPIQCDGGGTRAVSVTQATPGTPAAGDKTEISYTACVQAGVTIGGKLSSVLTSVQSFNPGQTTLTSDLTLDHVTLQAGNVVDQLDGRLQEHASAPTDVSPGIQLASDASEPAVFGYTVKRFVGGVLDANMVLHNLSYIVLGQGAGGASQSFSAQVAGSFRSLGNVSFTVGTDNKDELSLQLQQFLPLSGTLQLAGLGGTQSTAKFSAGDNVVLTLAVPSTAAPSTTITTSDSALLAQALGS